MALSVAERDKLRNQNCSGYFITDVVFGTFQILAQAKTHVCVLIEHPQGEILGYCWRAVFLHEIERVLTFNDVLFPLNVELLKLPLTQYGFCWLDLTDSKLSNLKPPFKKVYVLDREETGELEQAKEAQKKLARIQSSKWSGQRHEAARRILGVRKGRW